MTASNDAQVRERCEKAKNLLAKGPGFALYAVLDFVVDDYVPVVAQLEKDFDAIEADIFKDRFDRLIIERLSVVSQRPS
jgi:magnesium transporter